MAKKTYKINSFFAGIGGFDLGFENQGFEAGFICEINDFCNNILSIHWPDVKRSFDIRTLNPNDIPQADVWCGGFPCQDISVARAGAQRLGLEGERSGLFYEYANLIEAKRPEVVIIENVEGLFSSNKGRDFGIILQRMNELGYAIAWRKINSRYFGVPQSRTRVYICCWKNNPEKALKVMFDHEGAEKPQNARKDFITKADTGGEYPQVPIVSYCLAASSGRHTGTDWSRTYVVCQDGVRRLTPKESERLQGFPDSWTLPEGLNMDEDEIDTLRYEAIGNAVSVPVIEWIANRVKKQLSAQNSLSQNSEYKAYVPEFSKKEWVEDQIEGINFMDENLEFEWDSAGLLWKGSFISSTVHPTPSKVVKTSLGNLVEKVRVANRYYLSPNAAEGILRRVDGQKRNLFGPLRAALEIEKAKNIKKHE